MNMDLSFNNIYGKEESLNYMLVRESDGLIKHSNNVKWVEWDTNNGKFKANHETIAVNFSLLMSPFNGFFTWQTTLVTEIVEEREDYVKFKTENSTYELFKVKHIKNLQKLNL